MKDVFQPVDLVPWMNRRGCTPDHERAAGRLNAWGNSYPAEEIAFGASRSVGGISFVLARSDASDHVECLGQRIDVEPGPSTSSVALLCCGEMGERVLDVVAVVAADEREALDFRTPGWLVDPSEPGPPEAWVFTHLHYPGDYELALLRPALFCVRCPLATPRVLHALELGMNPFFHIFAATLCHDV